MIQKKRHHPLSMVIDLWGYIKGAFIPAIILFVFNYDSQTFIMKYGRYAFYIITILAIVFFILKWCTYQYALKEHAFHLYSGYFDKEEQTIPYSKVQNVNRKTSALHRLFHRTSIQFETTMSRENATITFNAVTEQEAEKMEDLIHGFGAETPLSAEVETEATTQEVNKQVIHFTPTTRDTIRAFFTSFSFLILIPLILSVFVKINQLFDMEEKAENLLTAVLANWWMTALIIIVAIFFSVLIGVIRIYLKYGKYEIASDENRLYISQGILNETAFSIAKKNVQALKIEQSLVKRMLGIVEIKLISAGNNDNDDDELEASALYPFLKKARAYTLLNEILPHFQFTEQMSSLPQTALWIRLLRGYVIYLLPAVALFYFKPTIWNISQAWWIMLILLFIAINIGVVLRYRNSAYGIHEEFVQRKDAALGSSLFISKREKVMEMMIHRSFLQQKLGLATVELVTRSHPVKHTKIPDIPLATASIFYHWYKNRTEEIQTDRSGSMKY